MALQMIQDLCDGILPKNGMITDNEGQDHSLKIEEEDMSETCREEFNRFLDPSAF